MSHLQRQHARVPGPPRTASPFVLSCLIAWAACLLLCAPFAPGQSPPARKPPPVEIVQVNFGWDGSLPPERFAPVIVWLTSTDEAFAGELSIQYKQDATQSVRYSIPVATTPGKRVPFELAAAVPRNCDEILISVTDGRREERQWFRQFTRDGDKEMPLIEGGVAHVLIVGDLSARSAFANSSSFDLTPAADASETKDPEASPAATALAEPVSPAPLWKRAKSARLSPADMPRNWAAYQSLDAAAVDAADFSKIDSRAMQALLTWVESGGRLVVVTHTPGSEWRRLLPPGPAGEVLSLAENTRASLSPEVRTAISEMQGTQSAPPYTIPVRPVTVTREGRRQGWRAIWDLESNGSLAPAAESAAGAIGPMGFGMIAILGADPQSMAPVLSAGAERGLWRDVIGRLLPARTRNMAPDEYSWGGPYSDSAANLALTSALDAVTTAEPIGAGVFILIAGSMAVLVGLVGPFDGLVIRRRRWGGKSWLFAVLWVALATAAAYIAPALARSGQTLLTRLTITETICGEDGLPSCSLTTGFTGIFGGKPASPRLSGSAPGAWWRGVAAVNYMEGGGRAFSPLTAPIRNDDGEGSTRSAIPPAIAQGQWTFRTLMDNAPATGDSTQVGARIAHSGEGWDITLFNVPESAQIGTAELLVGGELFTLSGETPQSGSLRRVRADTPVPETSRRWVAPSPYFGWPQQQSAQAEAPRQFHTAAADLPHSLPACRVAIDATETRVFHGDYATLFLELSGSPCVVELDNLPNVISVGKRLLRITTPIPPADAAFIKRPTPQQLLDAEFKPPPAPNPLSFPGLQPPPPPQPPPDPAASDPDADDPLKAD